jgi:hypothetical protein
MIAFHRHYIASKKKMLSHKPPGIYVHSAQFENNVGEAAAYDSKAVLANTCSLQCRKKEKKRYQNK